MSAPCLRRSGTSVPPGTGGTGTSGDGRRLQGLVSAWGDQRLANRYHKQAYASNLAECGEVDNLLHGQCPSPPTLPWCGSATGPKPSPGWLGTGLRLDRPSAPLRGRRRDQPAPTTLLKAQRSLAYLPLRTGDGPSVFAHRRAYPMLVGRDIEVDCRRRRGVRSFSSSLPPTSGCARRSGESGGDRRDNSASGADARPN